MKKFKEIFENSHPLIWWVAVVAAIAIMFTSCYTSGYGCKGRSRNITGEGYHKRGVRF